MDILKELCENYELSQKLAENPEQDDDILNCPLGYSLDFNPNTGKTDISIYKSNEDRVTSKILNNIVPSQKEINYSQGFPQGFFMKDSEEDQLYDQLLLQTELEDMLNSETRELSKLRDEFWSDNIIKHEKKELLKSLIQNDGSSSYDIDLLRGNVENPKLGFLPEMSKMKIDSKQDTNIANFKKEYVVRQPMKVKEYELEEELRDLGTHFLAHMEENLQQGGDFLELAEENLLKDQYDEINKSGILPTSKRETRYLLGLDDENESENQIEGFLKKVVGDKKKSDFDLYTKKRRKNAATKKLGQNSTLKSNGASLESLMKAYEENTGRKIIKVKSKKLGSISKQKLNYKYAFEDNTDRAKIDEYFNENPMIQEYPFRLDDFQARAVYHLEKKESVFVAAHTSAGKTVVAEYAISLAIQNKSKAIYTSPIKALSNQKYREFSQKYEDVGIVTGDVNLNPDASCVIMTTEILRNMLYRGADSIKNIEWIIFDEIHYINNDDRGVVWEESIIMLPEHIGIVMLSATVENVMEFAEWVGRITGKKIHVQKTDERPVPLEHWVFYDNEMVQVKTKEEKLLRGDYERFLSNLGKKKAEKNKNKQNRKDKLREKQDELSKMGNQKKRLKKLTGMKMKANSADYLLKKQLEMMEGKSKPQLPELGDLIKLINKLKKDDMLPAIVFVFSKKRLTYLVQELERSITLVTRAEQKQISYYYHLAIKRLKPTDQSILQLTLLKDTLLKGIGVHHGDLLHIAKEIVEILLQKGLIKLLFATDSFAMGLNMPTKTVIFNGTRKFDGKEMRYLFSSEYTQMSGRAGRRGLDDRGRVISFYHNERDLPDSAVLLEMLGKKGESLESKFKLSYTILFNALSSQIVELEDIMKKSFGENQNFLQLKSLKEKKEKLKIKSEKEGIKCEFVDIEDIAPVYNFKKTADDLYEASKNYFSHMIIAKKLNLFRFAEVIDNDYNYYLVILERFELVPRSKYDVEYYTGTMIVPFNQKMNKILLEGIQDANQTMIKNRNRMTHLMYTNMWFLPQEIVRVFDAKVPNLRRISVEDLAAEFDSFQKLIRKGKVNEVQLEDLKGDKFTNLQSIYLESRDRAVSSLCKNCELKDKHLKDLNKTGNIQEDLNEAETRIKKCEVIFGFEDCQNMIEVLREFKYINDNNIPQLKTRVARELGGGSENIYISEMIMENILEPLDPPEIVALVSIFVAHGRSRDEIDLENMHIPENLRTAINQVKEIYEKIKESEEEKKLSVGEEPNFLMIKPLYEWAKGCDFIEVCEHTEVLEGAIVRSIQRVERTLKSIKKALTLIGNKTLIEKVDTASEIIKRDIVFSLSLYIDQSNDFF